MHSRYDGSLVTAVRRHRTPIRVALVALVVGMLAPAAFAQDGVDDLREAREEGRRDAAQAAAQLDALGAEDLELAEALQALDAHIALQESRIAATLRDIEAAEAEAALAQAGADELALEIEAIRDRLRQRAVDAFVAPGDDTLRELDSDDLLESALRREFLDDIVGDEYELVDHLRLAIAEQDAATAAAAELLAEAEAERADLERRLAELDEARLEAEELRAEVQVRVAEWQQISDEIEEADRLIAEEIRQLEEEARRLAAEEEARRAAEEEARRLAEEEAARQAEEDESTDDPADEDENADNPADDDDPADDGEQETVDPEPSGEFRLTHRPVPGIITSPFGDRIHPIFGYVRKHNGLDIDGDTGDPIVAGASGTVLSAGWRSGYGNTVVISHGNGYTTLYAHQTDIKVNTGDTVQGGEVIGWVGSTGWSTGPHLHLEVRLDGVALDPMAFYAF